MQGSYFTQKDLMKIAADIDSEEEKLLKREGEVNLGESQNASAVGDFSIQVLEKALASHGLVVLSSKSAALRDSDPELEEAFIIHSNNHWFSIRKVDGDWYLFNSVYKIPEFLPRVEFLNQLKTFDGQGFTWFVVRGEFPKLPQPYCFGYWYKASIIKKDRDIKQAKWRQAASEVADRTHPPTAPPSRDQDALAREVPQCSSKLMVADRTHPRTAPPSRDQYALAREVPQCSRKLMGDENEDDKFKMLMFKIDDCPKKSHRTAKAWANCPLAHEHEPCRRRHPGFGYRPILCQNGRKCPNGNLCDFAHNRFEVCLHPEIYKTKLCDFNCKHSPCFYAHSQAELRKPKRNRNNNLLQNLRRLGETVARATATAAVREEVERQWDMWA